jgi:hypothetical protein
MYIPVIRNVFVPTEVKDVDIDGFVNDAIQDAIRQAQCLHPKAEARVNVLGKRHYVITLLVERRL